MEAEWWNGTPHGPGSFSIKGRVTNCPEDLMKSSAMIEETAHISIESPHLLSSLAVRKHAPSGDHDTPATAGTAV